MKRNEKGITLIALTITIIVLGLISVPIVINTSRIKEFNNYKMLKDDIDNLRESISVAFFDDDISGIGPKINNNMLNFLNYWQNGSLVKNVNDNDTYYVINIDVLNEKLPEKIRFLNYGDENNNIVSSSSYTGSGDVYIINEASRTIYYVNGIEYNGNVYYRLAEEFSSIKVGGGSIYSRNSSNSYIRSR